MAAAHEPFELPQSMAAVAGAIGYAAAVSLIHVYGGADVYIPKPENADDAHPLARFLGRPCFDLLAAAVGGGPLRIPAGHTLLRQARSDRVVLLWRSGAKIGEIARTVGLSQQGVYQILRRWRGRK